jgi:hypothetical protein
MLVFMDESGHPHPNDASPRPALVAVCIRERDVRDISRQLYGLKKRITGRPEMELKSVRLITRTSFRRKEQYRELVEAFFDLCRNLPLRVFAIAMERPTQKPSTDPGWLPNQHRYLLQRIHLEAQPNDDMATMLFDGGGTGLSGLARKFEGFLFRSNEGQSLTSIADAPYFVDSKITAGIQIADLMASVVRQFEENELFRGLPAGDPYLSAISRYYRIIESLTTDFDTDEGKLRGFYRMPERAHYMRDQALPDSARQGTAEGTEKESEATPAGHHQT